MSHSLKCNVNNILIYTEAEKEIVAGRAEEEDTEEDHGVGGVHEQFERYLDRNRVMEREGEDEEVEQRDEQVYEEDMEAEEEEMGAEEEENPDEILNFYYGTFFNQVACMRPVKCVGQLSWPILITLSYTKFPRFF